MDKDVVIKSLIDVEGLTKIGYAYSSDVEKKIKGNKSSNDWKKSLVEDNCLTIIDLKDDFSNDEIPALFRDFRRSDKRFVIIANKDDFDLQFAKQHSINYVEDGDKYYFHFNLHLPCGDCIENNLNNEGNNGVDPE